MPLPLKIVVINKSSLGHIKWEEMVFLGNPEYVCDVTPIDLRHSPAIVDPHEPPMSPKVTVDQAVNFAESLARGTPNRRKIALTVAADKVRELD